MDPDRQSGLDRENICVEACNLDGLSEPDDGVGNVTNATAVDRFGPIIGGKQLKEHHEDSVTEVWVFVGQQR